jgi:hypothetical protein
LRQVHLRQGTGEGCSTHPHNLRRLYMLEEVHLKEGSGEDGWCQTNFIYSPSSLVNLRDCNFN